MQQDAYVAALKREREHYAQSGRKDRVSAVDAELARLGSKPEPVKVETAAAEAPETTARPRAARKAAR